MPVTLAAISVVGVLGVVGGADKEGGILVLGLFGATLGAPAAILATVVLGRTGSRRAACVAYAAGVLLLEALLGSWAFYVIRVHGTGEAADQLWALAAAALALFAAIVPIFGAIFRRIALKRANALAAERAGRTGFHPTEVCAHCSHPLLSDASRCAECGSVSERS